MPAYDLELTSPKTGRVYNLEVDRQPSPEDIDHITAHLDKQWYDANDVSPEIASQEPVGSFVNSGVQTLAKTGTGAVGGLSRILDKGADIVANVTGTQKSGFFGDVANVTDALQEEAARTYPVNPANKKSSTIGAGMAQGMGLLAGGAVGKAAGLGNAALTAVPLVSGGLSGANEGIKKAEEIGVQTPQGQLAMGLLFGGVEAGTEMLGGIGNKAAMSALMDTFKKPAAEMLKQAAKSIGGESVEEVIAGSAQDLLTRAFAMEDPNNPGFTKTGVELPKMDRKMLEQRGLEALGGAAGGTIFAGLQAVQNARAPVAPQGVDGMPLRRVFTLSDGRQQAVDFESEPGARDLVEVQAHLEEQAGNHTNQNDSVSPNQTDAAAAPTVADGTTAEAAPMVWAPRAVDVMAAEAGAVTPPAGLKEHTGDLTAEEVADLEGKGIFFADQQAPGADPQGGGVNESHLSGEPQAGMLPGDVTAPADFTQTEAQARVDELSRSLAARGMLRGELKALPAAGAFPEPVQRALDFGKAFAGLFGRRVVAVGGLTGSEWGGVTSPAMPDTVFWNPERQRSVSGLVGHEMLHHLEVQHPDLFERLDEVLEPAMQDMDAAREQYRNYRSDLGVRREVYADLLGRSLHEPQFWNRMAAREPGIFAPLARAVVQWFGKVIEALKAGGWSASPYFKDLQKAQDVLAQAMVEFARRHHGMPPQAAEQAVRDLLLEGAQQGPNETQARFASPNAADRVIDGPRTDEQVSAEAKSWLGSVTPEQAVARFESHDLPLSLDAQQHAAGLLITQFSKGASEGRTEVLRMHNHALAQKMARIWTKEYLSADPARALRQRAVVNATILGPMAPVLVAQEVLVDRATKVMDKRFDGGAEAAAKKVTKVVKDAEKEAGDTLAAQLSAERLLQDLSETWQRIMQEMQTARSGNGAVMRSVKDRLASLRDAARARRAAGTAQNFFADRPDEQVSDDAIIGAALLADGVIEYDAWKKAAQRELGEQTAERLQRIYAEASRLLYRELVTQNAQARGARVSEEDLNAESDDTVRERAEARASRIIYKTEERLRQGSKDLTRAATGDSINKAFREQVTNPMPLEAFQARLENLNVGADVAARLHQTAAREATDQQAMRDYRTDAVRERRAVELASQLIYKTEERLRQGSKDLAPGATGDSINKAFREQLKNPLSYDAFRKRLQGLGVPPEVSGKLYRTALREAEDRAKMVQFKGEQAARDLAKNQPALARMLNELRGKMYGGMNWQEIFTDLPDAQKQRQRALYERLLKDERLQGLNSQERLTLTNELDKAWQRERRKVFQRELKKAGVMGETKDSDRQKVVNAMPRLLRMVNLGLFNSEMFREAVAPEYGLRILDAKAASGLRKLAEEAYQQPEGILRNRKLGELLNGLQKQTGSSWSELMSSYWTASVLSGLRTQFDTFLAFVNGMGTNLMQAGMLIARSGNGRAAAAAHAQWWRALKEGVRESAQILYRGDYSYLKKFSEDMQKALQGESAFRPMPLGESLWRNGNVWQKWGMAPVMIWTGRLMAAADHINNTATTAGAQAVARALHPELYEGRVSWTAEEQGAARAQAWREVTGGTEPMTEQDKTTVQARMRELLAGGLQESDRLAASNIGDMAAYQNDPTGVFGAVYGAAKAGLSTLQRKLEDGAGDVETNIVARALMAAAAGSLHGITGTRFMRFGFNFGADITRYMPGSYVLGRLGFYGREVSRMEQDLLLGKNLVGLMMLSTLAAVFLGGGDDDEGLQIEGDWSNLTPQQQKERMAAGYERMTISWRENGQVRRVSYKQWPTMGLFAAVGAMQDEKRHKPDQWAARGVAGHLQRAMLGGLFQIQNVSAMRGLADLFASPGIGSDPATGWGDRIVKQTMQYAGGFMPTFVKDLDAWNDPRSFKAEENWETFARTQPILRTFVNDGRPQLNLLGEEVHLQRAPWSRAYTSVESAEAHRVLGGLLSRGLTLPQPSDDVKVFRDGKKVPLSSLGREKVWQYEKAVGEGYKAWLGSAEGAELLTRTVFVADKIIDRRADAIRKQALAKVMR
ncbi:MAG: hypothetical protein ACYC67_24465 [Prosthecobacter sp.]